MTPRRYFLIDRDGTLIEERHYLSDPDEVRLLPGAAAALRRVRDAGYGLLMVTNQSQVGRGKLSLERLTEIHGRLADLLLVENVRLDGVYVCPHAPEAKCRCRKPDVGLVEQAMAEHRFDPLTTVVVGDKACDIELGRRIGATSVLVRTGHGWQVSESDLRYADYIAADLFEAVNLVLGPIDT